MSMSDELRDVTQELRFLRDAIVELKTEMSGIPKKLDDHETRIRELEKNRWPLPKVTLMFMSLGVVASIILPFIVK